VTSEIKEEPGEPLERRAAMQWLIRGFLSLWGLGAAALGAAFLKAPSPERRPEEGQVRCGSLSSLAVGDARFVPHGTTPLFVVRTAPADVAAVSAVCTHLRCIIKWSRGSRRFVCPCHAGAFDAGGNVLFGPPKQALRQYPAEVRADEIVVHL
jgi:cytochrome b6-f complex iron-sulfur subunit